MQSANDTLLDERRRGFLIGASVVAATALGGGALAQPAATAGRAPAMPFTLPPLPYAARANEPVIDAETMELHHDKHHGAYVKALNEAAAGGGAWAAKPLDVILAQLEQVPEAVRTAVRNNGGGHANHSMFWEIMGGRGGQPKGDLAGAIDTDFGSFAKLRESFDAAGAKVFGSGWVFVTVSREGRLALVTKPNQDTPLMDGQRVLFGNDVWEHAYYLSYRNRRADYLKAWWDIVDWGKVGDRYARAKEGALAI
ncbi:superoxide dismutase [Chelatococcus reniformis]|uniref:Superoxide dismutase n=1 Tax=Chelatococcus reniformis TaxID=1494448 RepID=A0A916XP44_9HYPH|nr:superoxide dismutase [Chelatococcus reniformis]GGC88317.1 superoxide dismutase [Chelatococcus reniformis]